jgi:hypothetical protein
MNSTVAHGACLCGGVSFAATLPSLWVAHCHCTRCQRAHGAAFVTWVGMAEASVQVSDPGRLLHWYEAPEGGSRGSCSRCGSPMFFKAPAWPGELHIARALFIDPVDREPQAHAYFDTHVGWVTLGDDLPRKPAPP